MGERKEAWFRILVLIISGIILKVWGIIVFIAAILNWFITIFIGKRRKGLALFCESWNTEIYKYYKYLSSVTNKRPFPFSDIQKISKFER